MFTIIIDVTVQKQFLRCIIKLCQSISHWFRSSSLLCTPDATMLRNTYSILLSTIIQPFWKMHCILAQ